MRIRRNARGGVRSRPWFGAAPLRRLPAAVLLAALLPAASGCNRTLWWEYRDDPYIADVAKKSDQDILRSVNAARGEERQIALRILAGRASEARARGARDTAQDMEKIIIRRYFNEKDQEVRACIVRICAIEVGRGSTAMVTFLRGRIAAGEFPGYAALSLASLAPRDAVLDIDPLTRHPAPEIRYRAAEALLVLGDPRGYDGVVRVWRTMRTGVWPQRLEGRAMDEAKAALETRALRVFGRPLG